MFEWFMRWCARRWVARHGAAMASLASSSVRKHVRDGRYALAFVWLVHGLRATDRRAYLAPFIENMQVDNRQLFRNLLKHLDADVLVVDVFDEARMTAIVEDMEHRA